MTFLSAIRNTLGQADGQAGDTVITRARAGQVTLIDVRGHDEVARTGKAKGAVHIPLMRLPELADPRHPEFHAAFADRKPVAVYCASGARSARAVQILRSLGHADVQNIGGLGDWARAGGEIVR